MDCGHAEQEGHAEGPGRHRGLQHLHGCREGVHAALALQGLAGLLQVCDCGCRCYICIAPPGTAVGTGSEPPLITTAQTDADCPESLVQQPTVIGRPSWKGDSRHANPLPLVAILCMQSCTPRDTSQLLLQERLQLNASQPEVSCPFTSTS